MSSPMNTSMKSVMKNTLYYIHDPMCSWCWGFRPTWEALKQQLREAYPEVVVRNVIGGLAPDSNEPMPLDMQQMLQSTWQRIQRAIPDTQFNYDFWQTGEPRRSTYPACRAVIAAAPQGATDNYVRSSDIENAMIFAIQQAYYLHAQNPSNTDTLIACAEGIGLDTTQFAKDLNSDRTQALLLHNIEQYQHLSGLSGVSGFPSLVLHCESDGTSNYRGIALNYTHQQIMFEEIKQCISTL